MMIASPQTLRPRFVLGFIAFATILSILIGGLAKTQRIALDLDIAARLPPPSPYWHGFVAVVGLLMPIMIRVWKHRQPIVCQILNAYLIVFLAQIISELVMMSLFLRGISVILGSLYSAFRVLQLWQSQSWVARSSNLPRWLSIFLWGLLIVWIINLLRFIGYRWPILLS